MARTLEKAKGRKDGKSGKTPHSFVMFQHRMLKHPAFLDLSARACKALLFLASQFDGSNNGDLAIAAKVVKKAGLKGGGNLRVAVAELVEAGFVILTRQGGRHRCSLFALSWFPINECKGKLDVPSSAIAPNDWLWRNRNRAPSAAQSTPPVAQSTEILETTPPH